MKEGAFGAYINAAYRQHPLWWLTPPPCPLGSVSLDSRSPIGSLQHGYHRLTGFSGRSCSPTNPVRWCDSSSLATPYSGGTMGAGQWRQCEFMAAAERKPNNRASPGGKQANRPVGRLKCTPSAAYRRRLPRRGRFALHSASGLISLSRHSAAKTSPSGGSTAAGGDRGAFPTGAARFYGFRCLWQRCRRQAAINLIAAKRRYHTL